jgi:hypothetical protein
MSEARWRQVPKAIGLLLFWAFSFFAICGNTMAAVEDAWGVPRPVTFLVALAVFLLLAASAPKRPTGPRSGRK